MVAKNYRDVDDAEAAHEKHGRGQTLHCELEVRADAVNVIVHAQQKHEGSGAENGQQRPDGKSRVHAVTAQHPEGRKTDAAGKRKVDGDAAEARQRTGMEMTVLGWNCDQAM